MYKPEPGKRNCLYSNTLWSEENFVIIVVTEQQLNLASCVFECVHVCMCVMLGENNTLCFQKAKTP